MLFWRHTCSVWSPKRHQQTIGIRLETRSRACPVVYGMDHCQCQICLCQNQNLCAKTQSLRQCVTVRAVLSLWQHCRSSVAEVPQVLQLHFNLLHIITLYWLFRFGRCRPDPFESTTTVMGMDTSTALQKRLGAASKCWMAHWPWPFSWLNRNHSAASGEDPSLMLNNVLNSLNVSHYFCLPGNFGSGAVSKALRLVYPKSWVRTRPFPKQIVVPQTCLPWPAVGGLKLWMKLRLSSLFAIGIQNLLHIASVVVHHYHTITKI